MNLSFTEEMIRSLFPRVKGIHHAKAGSSSMPRETAYSVSSTGLDSFTEDNVSQVDLPSHYCTQSFHPLVVFLRLCLPL